MSRHPGQDLHGEGLQVQLPGAMPVLDGYRSDKSAAKGIIGSMEEIRILTRIREDEN